MNFVDELAKLAPSGSNALVCRKDWRPRPLTSLPCFAESDDVYINVSAFSGLRARREDFVAGLALGLDDIGKKGQTPSLAPSAVVETSSGNYHWWYFFEEPCTDRALFTQLVETATRKYGDKAAKNAARWLRVPGYSNSKHSPPFRTRLVSLSSARFSTLELTRGLGLFLAPRSQPPAPAPLVLSGASFDDLCTALHATPGRDGWYDIICPWQHNHSPTDPGGNAAIHAPSAEYPAGGYNCFHAGCADHTIADLLRMHHDLSN